MTRLAKCDNKAMALPGFQRPALRDVLSAALRARMRIRRTQPRPGRSGPPFRVLGPMHRVAQERRRPGRFSHASSLAGLIRRSDYLRAGARAPFFDPVRAQLDRAFAPPMRVTRARSRTRRRRLLFAQMPLRRRHLAPAIPRTESRECGVDDCGLPEDVASPPGAESTKCADTAASCGRLIGG